MTAFRYELPESEPTSPWTGLSDEAKAALTRTAMGPSAANQLLTPDGSGIEGLNPEVASWARVELDNNFADGALGSWDRYEAHLGQTVPRTLEELLQASPNMSHVLEKLYTARQGLIASNEITPEDLNVGETMKLVLIPWKAIRDNLGRLPEWVKEMRDTQGVATQDDYLNDDLLAALQNDTELYRNPVVPGMTTRTCISAQEYLDLQLTIDGEWGVMLMQTSDDAGLKRMVEGPAEERSPDATTNSGTEHFKVADHNVDAMGIFEWLSLTFQQDPTKLSSEDVSWLLANRFDVDGDPRVPGGRWGVDRVGSHLYWAGDTGDGVRPRLAVM